MENGTSILFGLRCVAVVRVERISDEREHVVRLVHVVTTASSAAGCPQCGVVSTSVRQYRTTRMVKDAARIAFGFRNLHNQRRRVRLHCKRTIISQPLRG
jgi:transposase